jgi:hypothetical protein
MQCAYCEEDITDGLYTYMWFPEQKKMLTVHNHHLRAIKPKKREGK